MSGQWFWPASTLPPYGSKTVIRSAAAMKILATDDLFYRDTLDLYPMFTVAPSKHSIIISSHVFAVVLYKDLHISAWAKARPAWWYHLPSNSIYQRFLKSRRHGTPTVQQVWEFSFLMMTKILETLATHRLLPSQKEQGIDPTNQWLNVESSQLLL